MHKLKWFVFRWSELSKPKLSSVSKNKNLRTKDENRVKFTSLKICIIRKSRVYSGIETGIKKVVREDKDRNIKIWYLRGDVQI